MVNDQEEAMWEVTDIIQAWANEHDSDSPEVVKVIEALDALWGMDGS